ncbi:lipopolysaccharide biosynthesis protein [Paenibacillus aurantiacus]|uniref:Lipopolysaccharide biosynthesis protein n=1 Tax=Paenibacillus aurantiacus TaxID=1936118 RepID=A0ABV5L3W6_9BACL
MSAEVEAGDVLSKTINRIKKDIFVYGPALLIPALLNLFSTSVYTRIFSPDSYGDYALLLSTALLMTTLVSQWMQQSVQRYRPLYKSRDELGDFNAKLRNVLVGIMLLVLALGAAAYPLVQAYSNMTTAVYACVLLLIATQTLYLVCSAVLQSDLNSKTYRKVNIAGAVLKLGLALLFIYALYKNTLSIFIALIATNLIVLIPMLRLTVLSRKEKATERASFGSTLAFAKQFAFYGFPMVGWFLGNSLLNLCDRYIIGFFYSSREVGIYIANYSIVTSSIGLICSPLLTAAHPLFMNAASQSGVTTKQFEKLITMFSKVLLLFTIPIVGFVTVYRYEICRILLGEAYTEGALLIPLALVSVLLWNLSMYGHKGYEVREKTRWMLVFVLTSAVVNTALNFLLVPPLGYLGAAIAAIGGTFTYCFLVHINSKRFIAWRLPWASIARAAGTTAVMAALLLLVKEFFDGGTWAQLIVGGVLAAPIYAAGLIVTKEIDLKRIAPLAKKRANKKVLERGLE